MGLMTTLMRAERTKAQTSPERYLDGAVRTLEGSGMHGAKPWPFDQRKAMLQYRSWVYVAASGNARRAAKQPLRLYTRKLNRFHLKRQGMAPTIETRPVSAQRKHYLLEDERGPSTAVRQKLIGFGDGFEEVTDPRHPLIDLLRRPVKGRDRITGFDSSFFKFLCLELVGNAYQHPVLGEVNGRRIPVQLWPMPPHWTQIIPAKDHVDHYLDGYAFGVTQRDSVRLEPDEVLRFRYINPVDPLGYGIGKVEAAWSILNLHLSQRQFDIAFFDNHARPDFLLTADGATPPTADTLDRFESKINRLLRGVKNAGTFLTVPANLKVTPLQFPPKELGDRPEVIEEIMGVFGYPITKAKANDPNRANAETGDAGWLADTIHPMLIQDEEDLNSMLLPAFGLEDDACLAYDDPVPKNRDFMLRESTSLVQAGIRTINEDRIERGADPIDGGDVPRINGQSIESLDKQADAAGSLGGLFSLSQQPQRVEQQSSDPPGYVVRLEEAIEGVRVMLDKSAEPPTLAVDQIVKNVLAKLAERKESDGTGDRVGGADNGAGADRVVDQAGSPERQTVQGVAGQRAAVSDLLDHAAEDAVAEGDDTESDAAAINGDDEGAAGSAAAAENTAAGLQSVEPDAVTEPPSADIEDAALSHRALLHGECGHDHGDGPTLKALWQTYTKADAEDTVREDEPETPIERLARELSAIFARQRAAIAAAIETIRQRAKPKGGRTKISDADRRKLESTIGSFNAEMDATLGEFLEQLASVGAEAGASKIGAEASDIFNVTNPRVSEFLGDYTVRLRQSIQGYTGDAIARTIDAGLNAGQTPVDLARMLRDDAAAAGGALGRNRSEMIARTESARAYVEGEQLAWEESGVVEGRKWLLAPGACPFCKAIAEEFDDKAVPLGEPFRKQGEVVTGTDGGRLKLDYTALNGPPLHPHCRCDVIPVLKDA